MLHLYPFPLRTSISRAPSTPTKSKPARTTLSHAERTPRPTWTSNTPTFEQTPRPSYEGALTLGFTLSYLRRVPELSEMARRVVKAEAKRRTREERKLRAAQLQTRAKNPTSLSLTKGNINSRPDEPIAPKMKRLFQWAIIKLYEEGSIVLWDGAIRSFPLHLEGRETSGLWKINSTAGADSTVFSSVSFGTSGGTANGEEEAYITLTPAHLAPHVEKAIGTLMARSQSTATHTHNHTSNRTHKPAPPPGPTKEEITTFLRRMDGRWARVGEWLVDDALEALRGENRVWCVGKGRWELCL